jgi:hypothetical protein
MALSPYFGNDPFFGQMERALDNAFQRALGGRSGDLMMFPSLLGPSNVPAGSHPMVSLTLQYFQANNFCIATCVAHVLGVHARNPVLHAAHVCRTAVQQQAHCSMLWAAAVLLTKYTHHLMPQAM